MAKAYLVTVPTEGVDLGDPQTAVRNPLQWDPQFVLTFFQTIFIFFGSEPFIMGNRCTFVHDQTELTGQYAACPAFE